jgi:hypothetical protein
MFYKVQLTRLNSGVRWITPYIFTSKTRAKAEAIFWDSFYGAKYDPQYLRTWKAKILNFKKKPRGIMLTPETTPQRMLVKNKGKNELSAKEKVQKYLNKK